MSYPNEEQQAVLRPVYGTPLDSLAHGTVVVFDVETTDQRNVALNA